MFGVFFNLLATALSLLVLDILFKNGVDIANFPAAMVAAAMIGLVNAFVRPVLSLLSLPLNFLTVGLFSLVINGFCFWLASVFTPGFAVRGLLATILSPVILTFVNTFLTQYLAERHPALMGTNPGVKQIPEQ